MLPAKELTGLYIKSTQAKRTKIGKVIKITKYKQFQHKILMSFLIKLYLLSDFDLSKLICYYFFISKDLKYVKAIEIPITINTCTICPKALFKK